MNPSTDQLSAVAPFPNRAVYAFLAFLVVTILIGLGHPPLIDPDEPVYGETGRVMAVSHSFAAWWTPHYNGAMWFDKPPVTYWLVGLSMTLFGTNDFAARLPMALATVALVWVVARLAWRLYPESRTTPFWAALVFGTCAQTLMLSRSCVTDMLLALCLTAALLGVWRWLTTGKWKYAVGVGVAVGVGTLVKGPVAIVLVGGQILLYLLISRQGRRIASPQIWAALLLSLAIAAPWYAGMVHLHGQFFIQSFLEAQNVTRYVKAEHAANAALLFFVPVLIVAFLPWTFSFVPALVAACRSAKAQLASVRSSASAKTADVLEQSPDAFAVLWIALVFLFFSASQTKLITYIYPLYPLAACFTGYWLAEVVRQKAASALSITVLLLVYAGYIGAALFLKQPATDFWLGFAALVTLIGWIMAPRLSQKVALQQPRNCTARLAAAALGLALLLPVAALSGYWQNPDPKEISAARAAKIATTAAQLGAPIYCLVFNKPSVVYYSHRHVVFTDNRKMIAGLLSSQPTTICVTKPDILDSMAKRGILTRYTVLSVIHNKAVVITGQAAQTPR